MYCSTCGAHVPDGRAHCATCGAAVLASTGYTPVGVARPNPTPPPAPAPLPYAHGHAQASSTAVHTCARCGYSGEGVPYFNRGAHIAGLVVLGLLSAGFMGLFALIYYFSFHDHQVCPRCGKDWGKRGRLSAGGRPGGAAAAPSAALPGTGSARQGWAVVLFILAALMVVGGFGEGEAEMVAAGAALGAGGWFLHQSARQKREARREALLTSLQLPVLKLAADRQGRLTVSEVSAILGWPLPRAEKVLQSLDDGFRVSSEVTDEGVIVYEFRELAHTRQLPGRAM